MLSAHRSRPNRQRKLPVFVWGIHHMATRGRITLCYYEFNENLVPPYCMMTGERTDDVKTFRFFHVPRWLYFALILPMFFPVFFIGSISSYRSRRVCVPLTAEQHQFFLYRRLVFLFFLLTHLITICALSLFAWWFIKFMPVWLVYFSAFSSVIIHILNVLFVLRYKFHIVHVSDTTITFGGVHPTFIEMIRTTRGIRSRELER